MRLATIIVVVLVAHGALADPQTQLIGRITESKSRRPIQGAIVTIAHDTTALEAVTDANGLYRFVVPDENVTYKVTYRYGDVSGQGSANAVAGRVVMLDGKLEVDSESYIFIRDPGPITPPKMVKDARRRIAPAYSDTAILEDAWTRAWLLLDIDAQGTVTRVKMLNAPGYDLEPIAIRQAFQTKFAPAHDAHGNSIRSLLVWTIEWPSYWYSIERENPPTAIPDDLELLPCRGSGPLKLGSFFDAKYRDCTPPDLTRVTSAKWISKP